MAFGFLAAAAAPVMDTLSNVGLSLYSMNRQAAQNRADWNHQVDMFNITNDVAAQMKRYKDAGLNPNLIYGNSHATPVGQVNSSSLDNFNKVSMFSDALDGYQNRKDAEDTLQRLEKEKEEARKRQEIMDNRQAKAFEMEMKLKQAQLDNLKARPYLEAQAIQAKEQKTIEKEAFQSLKSSGKAFGLLGGGGPLSWMFTDAIKKRALGVVAPYSASAVLPSMAMGYGFRKWLDFLTSDYVLNKATEFGNKYGYKGTFWSK